MFLFLRKKTHLNKKLFVTILTFFFLISSAGCFEKNSNIIESSSNDYNGQVIENDVRDSIINELNNKSIEIIQSEVIALLGENSKISNVDLLEIEVSSLNDNLIELVYNNYDNFFPTYKNELDVILNLGAAAVLITVFTTISLVGAAPIGLVFKLAITKDILALSNLISIAIDLVISSVQSYKESEYTSEFVMKTIKGVSEGILFGTIFAPIFALPLTVKTIRVATQVSKLKTFRGSNIDEIITLVQHMDTAAEAVTKNVDNINTAYESLPLNVRNKLSRKVFLSFSDNPLDFVRIVKSIDPFNTYNKSMTVLRRQFLDDVTTDAAQITTRLVNKSIKSLDELSDEVKAKILDEKNFSVFIRLFGDRISNELLEDLIKFRSSLKEITNILNNLNKNSKSLYSDLAREILEKTKDDQSVKNELNNFIKNNKDLIALRYGSNAVNNLSSGKIIFDSLIRDDNIDVKKIIDVIEGLSLGRINTLKELGEIGGEQLLKNLSDETYLLYLKRKQITKIISPSLRNEILAKSISKNLKSTFSKEISDGTINKIGEQIASGAIKNKAKFIEEFGDDIYKHIVGPQFQVIINLIPEETAINKSFLKEILFDRLSSRAKELNITESKISRFISQTLDGVPIRNVKDLDAKEVEDLVSLLGDDIQNYFDIIEPRNNRYLDLADIRGNKATTYVKNNSDVNVTNKAFAGRSYDLSTNPPYSNLLRDIYGDITFTKHGFPILDEFAIARINIIGNFQVGEKALSNIDIENANKLFFGRPQGIAGYTWHHVENGTTLILVPSDLHGAVKHHGGAAFLRRGVFDTDVILRETFIGVFD